MSMPARPVGLRRLRAASAFWAAASRELSWAALSAVTNSPPPFSATHTSDGSSVRKPTALIVTSGCERWMASAVSHGGGSHVDSPSETSTIDAGSSGDNWAAAFSRAAEIGVKPCAFSPASARSTPSRSRGPRGTSVVTSAQPVACGVDAAGICEPKATTPNGVPSGRPVAREVTAALAAASRGPGASSVFIESDASRTTTVGTGLGCTSRAPDAALPLPSTSIAQPAATRQVASAAAFVRPRPARLRGRLPDGCGGWAPPSVSRNMAEI